MWIKDRFIIKKKIACGSFGQVYEGQDTHNGNKDIICKINDKYKMNKIEINVMDNLNTSGFKHFPQLYSSGKFKNKHFLI